MEILQEAQVMQIILQNYPGNYAIYTAYRWQVSYKNIYRL